GPNGRLAGRDRSARGLLLFFCLSPIALIHRRHAALKACEVLQIHPGINPSGNDRLRGPRNAKRLVAPLAANSPSGPFVGYDNLRLTSRAAQFHGSVPAHPAATRTSRDSTASRRWRPLQSTIQSSAVSQSAS